MRRKLLDAYYGGAIDVPTLKTEQARCGDAYRKATNRTRKLFNAAVFERLEVKGGRLCHEQYRPPFDGVFTVSEFEYGTRVGLMNHNPNRPPVIAKGSSSASKSSGATPITTGPLQASA
ncbi:MAG: hypothetical protein ACYCO9_14500 [Streptosporangiaceae bacterium]